MVKVKNSEKNKFTESLKRCRHTIGILSGVWNANAFDLCPNKNVIIPQ